MPCALMNNGRTVYNRVFCMRVGVLRYYQVYSLFETEVALRGVALHLVSEVGCLKKRTWTHLGGPAPGSAGTTNVVVENGA